MNFKIVVTNILGYGNSLRIKHKIKPPIISEIIVDISASCNAECPFCPRLFMPDERATGFMTLELFKKVLDEATKNKINYLRLYSTAEPTLHPKFDEIIKIAKERKFQISVSTNASTLNKHINSLMQVDLLQLSIEGWDEASYEKYRYPLKFNKIYENIKLFHKQVSTSKVKPKVTTSLLITRKTDINKYIALWGDFVDEIHIHFMYEPVKYEEDKFVAMTLDTNNEYYSLNKQYKDFYCEYPFNILTVAYDGKVALCCDDFAAELELGNIKEDGIKTIFNSSKFNKIREQFYTQKLDLCRECSRFTVPKETDVIKIKNDIDSIDNFMKSKIIFNY